MSLAIVIGLGVLTATLAVLGAAACRRRQHARRALASALTGEIAATLETIEAQDAMAAIDRAHASPDERLTLPKIALPHFVIYESSASELNRLGVPLQRKVVYLFERLGMLPHELNVLSHLLDHSESGHGMRIRRARESLDQTLTLADDVLLSLRPIMSPRNQAKHLTPNPPKAA